MIFVGEAKKLPKSELDPVCCVPAVAVFGVKGLGTSVPDARRVPKDVTVLE